MIRQDIAEPHKGFNSLNEEQGASSWLTKSPIKKDYNLTKQLICDLVRIRYNWALSRLQSVCKYGIKFDLTHALSCKKRGFMSLGHKRNITVSLLTEVYKYIQV